MNQLTHLTIEAAHAAQTSRSDVGDDIIAAVQPLIDAEEGEIGGFWLDFIRPLGEGRRPIDGAAAFTIQLGKGGTALASCIVCWREEMARDAWRMVQAPATAPLSGRPVSMPTQTPWLAATLLMGAVRAPDEVVAMLGDLERCVAWALIETPI